MYKKTIFDNGLTLLTHQMKRAHSVSMGIWIKVGSRYEDARLSGISHFLEHLLFKGSKKYDRDAIKRTIEGKGGSLNGFTSEEITCYLAKVPSKNMFSSFDVLFDMCAHPLLKKDDVKRERTVIIEEIRMYKDLPQHMVQEQLDELMWPKHPLGRNIAGSIETVNSIERDTLLKFHSRFYKLSNMAIVFVGNLEHSECEQYVRKLIKKAKQSREVNTFERFAELEKGVKIKEISKEIEQTHLAIGFPAYRHTHPKRFMLNMISLILGGNMSSRLFDQIREKHGLAYEISAQSKRFYDTGAFYIHAGLDNRKVELALELIMKELKKLKRVCVPEQELNRAKEFYLGQLAMGLDDTLDHMLYLGNVACTFERLVDFDWIKNEIVKVKSKDLLEVAREIFRPEKMNVSLVGPIKKFDKERYTKTIEYIIK